MTDPNKELVERVIERLTKEGLLVDVEAKKLLTPMTTGKLNQDDWRIAFENSAARQEMEKTS